MMDSIDLVSIAKQIDFPAEEIPQLHDQDSIITTRVSEDFDEFEVGDVVRAPWNQLYVVDQRTVIDGLLQHPFYNELTYQQRDFLSKFKTMAVLHLSKLSQEDQQSKYEPPYTLEQIRELYPEDVYSKLSRCPVHSWRARTGIELIHREPTREELERIWKNWQLMPDWQKDISDQKSVELFGCTNAEHYRRLKLGIGRN